MSTETTIALMLTAFAASATLGHVVTAFGLEVTCTLLLL